MTETRTAISRSICELRSRISWLGTFSLGAWDLFGSWCLRFGASAQRKVATDFFTELFSGTVHNGINGGDWYFFPTDPVFS